MVRCRRCGRPWRAGEDSCGHCGAPFVAGVAAGRGRPPAAPAATPRSRWLTRLILASVALLLLLCLGLVVTGLGLTASIRWV